MTDERAQAVKALQERRTARGLSDPLNRLRAITERAIADGAEIVTEQPADYFKASDPLPSRLDGMTQARWNSLSPAGRDSLRDNSHMTPQLLGLEGWRVEVIDAHGEQRRFIVGRSTGWRPCHLELYNRRSCGGNPARAFYQSVTRLEKIR